MTDPRHIHISDYNYPLPDERIAKFPIARRDHSKLLLYKHGEVGEDMFYNLPNYLPKGALMVFNNTKVIQARMHFRKTDANGEPTGALIEIFLLEPAEPSDYELMFQTSGHCAWYCLIGNLKKWKGGPLTRTITINNEPMTITATRGEIWVNCLFPLTLIVRLRRVTKPPIRRFILRLRAVWLLLLPDCILHQRFWLISMLMASIVRN